MSQHALLSPSSAHRWLACAASVAASQGIPDTPSVHAAEGTHAHDIAAMCLRTGADVQPGQVAEPEALQSRMRIDNAMILNVIARPGDPIAALSRLVRDNHETPVRQAALARRGIRLLRSLLDSGVITRLAAPKADGRTIALAIDLPEDFALNQPLAHFALEALDLLPPESPTHALDVVSVVEAVLDDPKPVLLQQQWVARGEAVQEMKADGIEYDERMELLDEVTTRLQ